MERAQDRAARHQIDARAFEFPRTGSSKNELPLLFRFDQGMNDREQLGNLLHFIDHNLPFCRVALDQLPQALGVRAISAKGCGVEQVQAKRIWVM